MDLWNSHPSSVFLILTTCQLGFGYGSDSSALLSEVAVPVCVQEHERYYPTPPHPTPHPMFLFWTNTYRGTCMRIGHMYMRPQGSRGI